MGSLLAHAKQVIGTVRAFPDRAILFYSGGKDSIALLDLMAPVFKEVVCVFMYLVKDLDHINRFLRDARLRYPNVKIAQVPHWTLTHIYRNGTYCPADSQVKLRNLQDIDAEVKRATGIEWSFYGFKKADSLNRRLMLMGYEMEAISHTGKAYPLSLWRDREVLAYITENQLAQPVSYGTRKRSNGVGLSLDVFLWLEKHYPQDLEKIYLKFPESRIILRNHHKTAKNDQKD